MIDPVTILLASSGLSFVIGYVISRSQNARARARTPADRHLESSVAELTRVLLEEGEPKAKAAPPPPKQAALESATREKKRTYCLGRLDPIGSAYSDCNAYASEDCHDGRCRAHCRQTWSCRCEEKRKS